MYSTLLTCTQDSSHQIDIYRDQIVKMCDSNADGKIGKDEFKLILNLYGRTGTGDLFWWGQFWLVPCSLLVLTSQHDHCSGRYATNSWYNIMHAGYRHWGINQGLFYLSTNSKFYTTICIRDIICFHHLY